VKGSRCRLSRSGVLLNTILQSPQWPQNLETLLLQVPARSNGRYPRICITLCAFPLIDSTVLPSSNTVFVLLQDLMASAVQLRFDHKSQVSTNPTYLLFKFPSLATTLRLRSLLYVLSKYVRKHHLVALAFSPCF